MPFYNGSNQTINAVAGLGPAVNTEDFLKRIRSFLVANGWTVANVVNIGSGQANLVFSSTGLNGDENINVRVQDGNVNNSLNPLNTPVSANRIRFTAASFFDVNQVVYNECGITPSSCELTTDDVNTFNFWIFTDGPPATWVQVITQVGGVYSSAFAGRMARQVYNQTAKTSQAIAVTTPGTTQNVTVNLDRARPTSWQQGTVLMILSQNSNDANSNGSGVGTQILPVELCTVQSTSGLSANQVVLTVSRNYSAGAIIGQDPCPVAMVLNATGGGESIAMTYDNGGGLNSLGYTAPAGQVASLAATTMAALDINTVLTDQGPDAYQGAQLIVPMFTFNSTTAKRFAFRHQLPGAGRTGTVTNPMDELLLSNGDKWLCFTIGGSRVAIGKEN